MTCTATGTARRRASTRTPARSPAPAAPGTAVTDDDPSHYFGVVSGIDIEKFTNGVDADDPAGAEIPVGDPVTWTYVVTNPGNVRDHRRRASIDDQAASTPASLAATPTATRSSTPARPGPTRRPGPRPRASTRTPATVTGLDLLEDPAHRQRPLALHLRGDPGRRCRHRRRGRCRHEPGSQPRPRLVLRKRAGSGTGARGPARELPAPGPQHRATARRVRVCDRLPRGLVFDRPAARRSRAAAPASPSARSAPAARARSSSAPAPRAPSAPAASATSPSAPHEGSGHAPCAPASTCCPPSPAAAAASPAEPPRLSRHTQTPRPRRARRAAPRSGTVSASCDGRESQPNRFAASIGGTLPLQAGRRLLVQRRGGGLVGTGSQLRWPPFVTSLARGGYQRLARSSSSRSPSTAGRLRGAVAAMETGPGLPTASARFSSKTSAHR